MSNPRRSAIVIVVDRMAPAWLGPYGNSAVGTEELNRLASQALVCDNAISDTPDVLELARGFWCGSWVAVPQAAAVPQPDLPARLGAEGIETVLVTDDWRVVDHPIARHFAQIERVVMPDISAPASHVSETQAARLFAVALQALDVASPPFLLWVQSRGLTAPWDSPLALRERLRDEDDPEPHSGVDVPQRIGSAAADPDQLHRFVCAYAGQIAALNACVGALVDQAQQHPAADETLIMLASTGGFPLGEHGRVGDAQPVLYTELTQMALMVRRPDAASVGVRSCALVHPCDVSATLFQWLLDSHEVCGAAQSLLPLWDEPFVWPRPIAIARYQGEWSLRTGAWHGRTSDRRAALDDPLNPSLGWELFLKPDDRWDRNNVADRCPEVLEALDGYLEMLQHPDRTAADPLPEVPEILLRRYE